MCYNEMNCTFMYGGDMTNSEIKNEAKTILSNLQGKNQLFLLPILLSIITLYISFYYQYNNMTLLDFFCTSSSLFLLHTFYYFSQFCNVRCRQKSETKR